MTKTSIEFTPRELKILKHIITQSRAAGETSFMQESEMSEGQKIFSAMHTRIIEAGREQ